MSLGIHDAIIPVGNFQMFGIWHARAYTDAWKAVDATPGGWQFLKEYYTSDEDSNFWNHPTLLLIKKSMKMLDQHSQASFMDTIDMLQYIAKHSWEAYIEKYKASKEQ
jgi:hypothetical protein